MRVTSVAGFPSRISQQDGGHRCPHGALPGAEDRRISNPSRPGAPQLQNGVQKRTPQLEWPENIQISDAAPSEYVPRIRERFSSEEWNRMHRLHALPMNWEQMGYADFFDERRKLMAAIIREGFDTLK
jgi:hypothetical protein